MRKRDIVINFIKEKINNGEYKPGQKILSEPMLAKYLNISRSTVREALKELAFSGLIDKEKGNGTYIKDTNNEKKKEFILIVSDSNSTEGYTRENYRYLLSNIKDSVTKKGYKPILFINNNLVNLQESMTEIISKTAGIITFTPKEEDVKFIKTLTNIPVVDTMRTISGVFPSVVIDYYTTYKEIHNLINKHNLKNPLIFSINHYNEKYTPTKNYFVAFPFLGEKISFSDFNFHSIDFSSREDYGVGQIEDILNNLKELPDCIIFTDDHLFKISYPLFTKYNRIFDNAKIITQSNDTFNYNCKSKIYQIVFDYKSIASQTVDLLIKIIDKEFVKETNIFIKPKIIE